MKRLAAAVALVVAPLAGAQEATFAVRGTQLPVGVVANGYQQVVIPTGEGEVLVRVTTLLRPIRSSGALLPALGQAAAGVPEGFRLPEDLASSLRTTGDSWEAATRVLEWVMASIRLDAGDQAPQDAVSVLGRGHGRCSGLANSAAALLLSAGFEARTVSGLLVGEEGAVPHRWVECRLPGAGWVPTDPTLGLWVVTPRHMAFAAPVHDLPEVRVQSAPQDELALLARRGNRLVRPNRGAELICRVVGRAAGQGALAVLSGPGGEARHAWLAPEGRFVGLSPGTWLLVVRLGGEVVARQRLLLEEGSLHSVAFPLHAGVGIGS